MATTWTAALALNMDLPLILNSATTLISLAVLILVLFRRNVELAMCIRLAADLERLDREVKRRRHHSDEEHEQLAGRLDRIEATKYPYPRNGEPPC